eukprot:CAMPEP_0176343482 /NCGR_PEP_ID=MMETSP0126-20121128/3974_1 /TAXON_ID=141414 ORGANISM="Strombidinopsis acuminatum, Strain SPMC142" /NCGR_SAMPLE_ID=MMETSP0126 /ASSEMBLY_ACC=CAM_ASM_000229 /LENGTH=62 /DNA_ID=CAMNT_0017689447 /DNA_START=895 /DNA_END=1083 /DNA_ORIENTATION=-
MDKLMSQLNTEEDEAKKLLDQKMDLDRDLEEKNEDLDDERKKRDINRDLLINLRRTLCKLDN